MVFGTGSVSVLLGKANVMAADPSSHPSWIDWAPPVSVLWGSPRG